MKRIFLEKYFPASRAANIRKNIYGIKQFAGESLHENILDASSGGVFVDKTPIQARNLIENMAANSQQFGTNKSDPAPRRNNEVGRIIPISDTETLQYTNRTIKLIGHRILHSHSVLKFQHLENRASIQQLNTQMGQLSTAVNRLEALNSNSLPSQTVANPKENVGAINLRSGKELTVNEEVVKEPVQNKDEQESKLEEDKTNQKDTPRGKFPPLSVYKPVAPFSLALKESRKDEGINDLYEIFRRSEMADRSTIYPRGPLEDVLVQVENLVFPDDFYVLDMKSNDLNSPILLGRLFLKTSKSIIDVDNGTLTMEFDGEIAKFNIFDTLKNPSCESVVNILDASKTESKLPPDRSKGIPKKSKKRKHETKLTGKFLK
ncbi:uncharacterized protein [Henckelia pumila]|uniref:uncharacterized protein n=1 Tax=Henckelia pumila TaxID=405737 RepID=UPI003C6DDF8A